MPRRAVKRHAAALSWRWVRARLLRLVWRLLPLLVALAFALDVGGSRTWFAHYIVNKMLPTQHF